MRKTIFLITLIFFTITSNIRVFGYYKIILEESQYDDTKENSEETLIERESKIEYDLLYEKYSSEPYTGYANYYSSSGNLIGKYHFSSGIKDGKYIIYYDSPQKSIIEEGSYASGIKHPSYNIKDALRNVNSNTLKKTIPTVDSEGNLYTTNIFFDDKNFMISEFITYHGTSNLIKSKEISFHDSPCSYVEYYKNKQIFKEQYYYAAIPNGEHIEYDITGNITSKITYNLGIMEGPFFIKDKNTNLYQSGTYINDIIEGDVISYFPQGQKSKQIKYKNGIKHGRFLFFKQNEKYLEVVFTSTIKNIQKEKYIIIME
ncbi:hypothetical protein [Fusobacterium sp. PH5-44]|uniref:toxin-antitoxin system YwqK family antitoxin n=1 Tax=unclassified Fusobacterium TaxID=2648384 RepID=UPI003D1CA537